MIMDRRHFWLIMLWAVVALFLDGAVTYALQGVLITPRWQVAPSFLLLWLVYVCYLLPTDWRMLLAGLVLGGVYDMYYSGIIGFYALAFPAVIYGIRWIRQYLPVNGLYTVLLYFISIVVVTSGVYFGHRFLGVGGEGFVGFVSQVLWPTILVNVVLAGVLYGPCVRLLTKWQSGK
ncbi:hypothetical protein L248_0141 [Schleiferilactobacillus shenzhenensis LY-73]|uniref:Uncharacterized protein n=2 Tax=Schleiferilactobacillus shenzhenensis TaxID=1231337 RepID=U4TYS4_9LACO|nr:hypothetical protein L248_0141 [Schleiferilactobacillus shenzhenensis LY-73]